LLESHAVPGLTYSLDAMFLSTNQLKKPNVSWNCVYRRLFGYHKLESVKVLQLMCERVDFVHIVDRLKFRLFNRLLACNNEAVV